MNLDHNTGKRHDHDLARLGLLNVAYAMLLIVLAVTPSVPGPAGEVPDVVAHAVAYGLQTLLLFTLLQKIFAPRSAVALACVGATMLGLLTEALQLLQPTRTPQAADVLANGIGTVIVAATIMGVWLIRRWQGLD
jgi:VanZ family protein